MEKTKCSRCDLLVAEVARTTKGRNDWFDRCAKVEREIESLKKDLKRCATERDEWIGHYQKAKAERAGIDYKVRVTNPEGLFVSPGSIAFDFGDLEERIVGGECSPKCDPRYAIGPIIPGGSL